ncbi:MAG: hypothetical protein Q9165_007344 [Trypethelium subeluteriae]
MEILDDDDSDVQMQDEDEHDLTPPNYNSAYGDITNAPYSAHAGPYFALRDNNVTSQTGISQQNDIQESENFQQSLKQGGEIFYDSYTSSEEDEEDDGDEEELQEIARRQGESDSPFSEDDEGTSEGISSSSASSEPDSEDLRGEGRRGPRPRGRPPRSAASRGPRRRGWKWALKGTEHDPARDRSPRGRRGGRAKQRSRRGPKPVRPAEEFQSTMSSANQAYLAGELEDALELAGEAILQNPEVYSAHSLLSQVLDELGRNDDAVGALLAGAHTSRDIQVWYHVAQRIRELGAVNQDAVKFQILYCYSHILTLNQKEHKARLERARIYMELGRVSRAVTECETMLKNRPHDLEVIRMLVKLTSDPEKKRRVWNLFEKAFQLHLDGEARDQGKPEWSDLALYTDLLLQDNEYAKAQSRLSQVARWLLGRRRERFWDDIAEDDREWDIKDTPRRVRTPGFHPGRYKEDSYGAGLPLEIRVKLGIIRLNMGPRHHEEAIRHFRHLEPQNGSSNAPILSHDDLFYDAANSLKSNTYFTEAIEYYEALLSTGTRRNWQVYSALAESYRQIGKNIESRKRLRSFVDVDQEHIDARVTLAKMCEEDGEIEEASELITEVIRLGRMDAVKRARLRSLRALRRRHPEILKRQSIPLTAAAIQANDQADAAKMTEQAFVSKANALAPLVKQPKRKPESYNDDIQEMYQKMKTLEESEALADTDALEDWLAIAEVMTEDFRAMRPFYQGQTRLDEGVNLATGSAISEMKSLASRISGMSSGKSNQSINITEILPDDYCGISWDAWLELFCQYALQLAKLQDVEACYSALTATIDSTVFQKNDEYMRIVHVCWLACGLILEDEQTVCNVTRWFIKNAPYTNEAISLYAIANQLLRCEPNWYNSGPSQKFFLRQVKGMDFALLDPKTRDLYSFTDAEKRTYGDRATKDNPHGLTEPDPALLMLYGHLLAVSGSFANALNYYFRAFTLLPEHPMVLFCLAVNYIQMAMKRQSDNRQFQIQQGLAFMGKYYEIRTAEDVAIHVQEAEFNMAKVWHLLGLNHMAIPRYQKCLALSKRVQEEGKGAEEVEDFAREAAFALQNIFAMSGQLEEARAVTEEWLVI